MAKRYRLVSDTNDITKFGMCLQLLIKYGETLKPNRYKLIEEEFLRLLHLEVETSEQKYLRINKVAVAKRQSDRKKASNQRKKELKQKGKL